jgi:hypothetical protein
MGCRFPQSEALRSSVSLDAAGTLFVASRMCVQKWNAEDVAIGTLYICVGTEVFGNCLCVVTMG